MLVSTLLGVWRGVVKEILSLVVWILSFGLGLWFAPDMLSICQRLTDNPTMQVNAAFLIVFFLALVLGMLLHFLLMMVVGQADITPMNRGLGGVFGFFRGVVFNIVLVLILGMTQINLSEAWQNSRVVPFFAAFSQKAQDFVIANAPANLSELMAKVQKARMETGHANNQSQSTPEQQAIDADLRSE
jgi:membrane protein required for colicin V production